jgi:hypothetical protein
LSFLCRLSRRSDCFCSIFQITYFQTNLKSFHYAFIL